MFSNFPTSQTPEGRAKLREIYLKDAPAAKRERNSWSLLHQSKPLIPSPHLYRYPVRKGSKLTSVYHILRLVIHGNSLKTFTACVSGCTIIDKFYENTNYLKNFN